MMTYRSKLLGPFASPTTIGEWTESVAFVCMSLCLTAMVLVLAVTVVVLLFLAHWWLPFVPAGVVYGIVRLAVLIVGPRPEARR